MHLLSIEQYGVFLLIVFLLVKPVGGYLARVFAGEKTFLDPVMRPVERVIYKVIGIDGTNGGGFFNVNGAHPYENPTPFTNLIEMLCIAVLPASLTNTFGRMIGRPREGWMLFWVMVVLFAGGLALCGWAEQSGNPAIAPYVGANQPMGNMEGKEVRFGMGSSVLTAVTTSNGATLSSWLL
jgi:K+-transporting ATPase A subunit